ncbi:MAG: putative DNA-binding domain-containing protein [Acidobacteria bacterium]|nr:putative DNA-binding domain-containing protein [Acidobacteriota bacterium]
MPELLELQRAFAARILDPEGETDVPWEAAEIYRSLVRSGLADPLESVFPVTRALLEEAGAWEEAVDGFLAARCLPSPHYRDIAPAFLGWLHATGWGRERWPFLAELAHAEILEVLVERHPDEPPPEGLTEEPTPGARLVLGPAAQLVAYAHAVHRCTVDAPLPEPGAACLLAYRGPEGEGRFLELTPATQALLLEAQHASIAQAAETVGLPDLEAILILLRDLRTQGAVAGFRPS